MRLDGYKYTLGKGDPHIPNKNEAKMVRKIRADAGLSKDEIRSIKKYRKILSESAKQENNNGQPNLSNIRKKLMKVVTQELKLSKSHPLCKHRFNELLESRTRGRGRFDLIFLKHESFTKKDKEYLKNIENVTNDTKKI